MNLLDVEYFKLLLKNPIGAIKVAEAVRIRAELAGKTITLLLLGCVFIVLSQVTLSSVLPIAILLSLTGACLVVTAGWLQFTFTKRSRKGADE